MDRPGLPAALAHWPPAPLRGQDDGVLGAIVIVVILVVAFPIAVLMSGAAASALLGWLLKEDADAHGDPLWKQLNY
jgi:hypothetical protein